MDYKGKTFMIDTGAEISCTTNLPTGSEKQEGTMRVYGFNKTQEPVCSDWYMWEGIAIIPNQSDNLLTLEDACNIVKENNKEVSVRWMKIVDLKGEIERMVKETTLDKNKVKAILEKHKKGAAKFKNDVGLLGKEYEYEIKGGVHKPQRQYPINKKALAEIEETVKELKQLGVIKEIENAATNSPLQAVPKQDQSWRLVTNFKALNKVTEPDTRYLINAKDVTNGLPKGTILTKIDLANGFWTVPLSEESMAKTAFTFQTKHYCYTRLPQGFMNSPNAFQAIVVRLMEGLPVTVYIDDLIIINDDPEEHLKIVDEVLTRLIKVGFKPSYKKIEIGKREVDFLGFATTGTDRGLSKTTREKLEDLRQNCPKNLKGLQSFMGHMNFIRDLIPGYAKLAKPLYSATKGNELNWNDKLEKIRLQLIDLALASGKIARREPDQKLVVSVENTSDEMELVLYNEKDRKNPIQFMSYPKPANQAKQEPKSAADILASIAKCLIPIKTLALDQQIIVESKGDGITQLARESKNLVSDAPKVHQFTWAKWSKLLQDTQIVFGQSKVNKKDKITEIPKGTSICYFTDGSKEDEETWWGFIRKERGKTVFKQKGQLAKEESAQLAEVTAVLNALRHMKATSALTAVLVTDSDYVYKALSEHVDTWKLNGFCTAKGKPLKQDVLWKEIAVLVEEVKPKVLHQSSHTVQATSAAQGNAEVDEYVRDKTVRTCKIVRAITKESEKDIVKTLHDDLMHPSLSYMARYCKATGLHIQNLKTTYLKVRKECPECRKVMTSRNNDYGSIKTEKENEEISADFAGPIRPQTALKNCYFLVIVDNCSNFLQVYPCKQATSSVVVNSLNEWIKYRGPPKRFRGDNAVNLTGKEVEEYCTKVGVQLIKSVKYQPSSNGIAESAVKRCKEFFVKNEKLGQWDTLIDQCTHFLNYRIKPSELKIEDQAEKGDFSSNPFKVGDQVIILHQVRGKRFKHKTGTVDTVINVTSNTSVELENNGIWSCRDIVKAF